MTYFRQLAEKIDQAMQADRHRLRNLLRAIEAAELKGQPPDQQLARFHQQLDRSLAIARRRQESVPPLVYDEALPITARGKDIVAAIREHQVLIVCGETGSGKSTQLPKLCLAAGRGIVGLIGHTQPRRIAARSIAARLAEELAAPDTLTRSASEGHLVSPSLALRVSKQRPNLVGYKIRFADQTSPETLIKVMTDGILLAETQGDRFLDQYDTIIIDEAHERSLNIDFLLGYLHRLLDKRPDLRLIITSATIDAERFARHFSSRSRHTPCAVNAEDGTRSVPATNGAPIIEVSGRAYPVEVRYRPPDEGQGNPDPLAPLASAVEECCQSGPGDVLVFLPTERDIREAAQVLRGRQLRGGKAEVLPLYARLTTAEQNRIFQPHSLRRIVLATNVAESSLTVPGIRFVVDTGTARISRYSPKSKVQRLPIEPVSQASCDQRKGRCGRIGPGICIRLYGEDDYLSRDRFTAPEIQRTNLAAVILQTLAFDLGPLDEFPLLDPPRPEAIRDGYKTLAEIGAIDEARKLTPIGRTLARLPVDPRIGRMILAADQEHCLADVLIIAAALETQDPRERPADKQQAADEAQARFLDPDSDFLSYLKLWDFLHHLRQTLTRGQFKKALWQSFLSETKVREWQEVHRQLLELVGELRLRLARRQYQPEASARDRAANDSAYAAIHRSILTGLLSSIALRGDDRQYQGAGGNKFFLWPGSGLALCRVGPAASAAPAHLDSRRGGPALAEASLSHPAAPWILAAELVETSRRYARTAARIEPEWIEPLAAHLVSRSYSDPHWSRKSGTVLAKEKISLFGLTIVPERRVRYGPIDPVESRKIFIQHALVEQDFDSRAAFFRHNRQLRDELAKLAAKTRRRDLIVDDYAVYRFYDERLPPDIFDRQTLEQWLKIQRDGERKLTLTRDDLVGSEADAIDPAQFPERLDVDRMQVPLTYRFEPGAERDGITAIVPREGLAQLAPQRLDWLVPGLVEEKLAALIRTLPKPQRQSLGPAPEAAKKAAGHIRFGEQPFLQAAAAALSRVAGEPIAAGLFDLDKLPPHLRINVRVLDDQGRTLAESRDLGELRARFVKDQPQAAAATPQEAQWHKDGITRWNFGALPPQIEVHRGGIRLARYPALVDQGDAVGLRLLDQAETAQQHLREGVRRLFALAEHRELKAQVQWLPDLAKLKLWSGPLFRGRKLEAELVDLLADRALYGSAASLVTRSVSEGHPLNLPRDERTFADLVASQRLLIASAAQDLVKVVAPLLEAYHEARLALETPRPAAWKYAVDDMRQQVADLTAEGFLTRTPWQWLAHYPRYFRGITARLKKMATSLPRDKQQHEAFVPRVAAWRERLADHQRQGVHDPERELYRWMLEELRVSLFAQELGTSLPISPQRMDKQWQKVRP